MPNLMGMSVSSRYLAITWEVYIAVGCVLANMCKNVVYMPIYYDGCVTNKCNVAVIFVQLLYAYEEYMLYIDNCYSHLPRCTNVIILW